MQFGIRDLLLLTTISACYAAGFAYLSRLDGGSQAHLGVTGLATLLAVMTATTAILWRRNQRALGEAIVGWAPKSRWFVQAMFLAMVLLYFSVCAARGKNFGTAYPTILIAQQIVFLASSRIVIGKKGVLLGMGFVPWSQCRIRLDEDAQQLVYSQDPQVWTPRLPIIEQRIAIPDDKVIVVREVLVEKESLPATNADTSGQ